MEEGETSSCGLFTVSLKVGSRWVPRFREPVDTPTKRWSSWHLPQSASENTSIPISLAGLDSKTTRVKIGLTSDSPNGAVIQVTSSGDLKPQKIM
ncbi:hypothetical protein H6P81_012368 [Aristolochia fimbriata]|uniref:Uncharacterized protein n=1 Tax=Aristolochia fimbriata TaxID=158543 RepID=A0AAV7EBM1_ARIFI|nr:hypothetical protein H6P81_012368 [Aristolochia fimbriata]